MGNIISNIQHNSLHHLVYNKPYRITSLILLYNNTNKLATDRFYLIMALILHVYVMRKQNKKIGGFTMKKLLSLTLATLLFASFAMAADNAPAKKATKKAAKYVIKKPA